MSEQARTLVLGVGNPLYGDDGVGPCALARLAEEGVPRGVDLVDGGTRGLDLLNLMQEYEQVFVLDAVRDGGEAGRILDFEISEVSLRKPSSHVSVHDLDLASVFRLAEALKEPLPPVRVLGISPARERTGMGLSPECELALPFLLERIRLHLDQIMEQQ